VARVGVIETDYLVVGAGAAGMAFTDTLVTESDADVVLVDRRHRPGGHWNDAYPFVRLHQPAAFYGVNSRVLGTGMIDRFGPNAGLYERVTAAEILDYYGRVLDEQLLPSGRVVFLGMSDHAAHGSDGHRVVSRVTGDTTTVRVRRKVVDATYLETAVPATHTPSFTVDPGVRFLPVNGLVDLRDGGDGYTVVGGGKTSMDACLWLLDNGVPPARIRWIRPRDAWCLDRAYAQPLDLVSHLMEGVSLTTEASALASDVDDLFRRLEACGQLVRLDPDVEPTMYRCATLSRDELDSLRRIDDVVRLGRVRRIGTDRIVLEQGEVPTSPDRVHVDCSADGLRRHEARPIFEPDRITVQQVRTCQPTFNAALLAFVECARDDDGEKNRLCPPNPYPTRAEDWITATIVQTRAQGAWAAEPDVAAWLEASRLNVARGIGDHLDDEGMAVAIGRYAAHVGTAPENLERLAASLP
jgi:hypothetical protein